MTDKIIYWASVAFGVLALLLMVTDAALINGNRALQDDVQKRQSTIGAAANMAQLNQNLAQALAELAVSKDDKDIRSLLASQGITLKKNEGADAKKSK